MHKLYFHFSERGDPEALTRFMAECEAQSVAVEVTRAVGWGLTARALVCAHTGTLLRTFFSDWELADPRGFKTKVVDLRLAAQDGAPKGP
jgi:hypothetical protein